MQYTQSTRITMDNVDGPGDGSGEELSFEYGDGEDGGFGLGGSGLGGSGPGELGLNASINQGSRVAGRAIRSDRGQ